MTGFSAPPPPNIRLSVGVTGHRSVHPLYAANSKQIEACIAGVFDSIDRATGDAHSPFDKMEIEPTRLHTLLVDGTDQVAANLALARGWELISPLPFGEKLNLAVNAMPASVEDAKALLAGEKAGNESTQSRAERIDQVAKRASLFELADQDDAIGELYLAMLEAPDNFAKAQAFALESAQRAQLAGRILIEQSDVLVAVWDGASTANIGGAGHTVATALDLGAPVIWINPSDPENWRILHAPESLALSQTEKLEDDRDARISALVTEVICPEEVRQSVQATDGRGLETLSNEQWRERSSRLVHAYRRVEALFSGEKSRFRSLVQVYEKPEEVAQGSGAKLTEKITHLPGADPALTEKITGFALKSFAWADGISARLSDHYRAGMVVNFLLSALAIVGGILYLPLVPAEQKWGFALFEFLLLVAIVIITSRGQKYRWHERWFETRRVAEYFRHSPLLLILGVARPPGRWPRSTDTSWPEWYVRQALRDIGLPRAKVTSGYLRTALETLDTCHVTPQRDYHFSKAQRLQNVHHNLDRFSEFLFKLALLSVATYLLLKLGSTVNILDSGFVGTLSKTFTVLGVLFPTFGAAIAGIRYFGDFERFAAISEVTAEKLDAIRSRILLLLTAPDEALDYDKVTELVHATDDVVVAEIENWQAVFGGKHITVPV
ncbi:hypothetical protein SAMN02745824_1454 [Parasphingorhabdus marina DSM 22363]|uniref:SMODS and SLOG-associating 2TM effector domain-containing protein n=1 Tax=Parasphingorhabdus marina DSM 22363 TaxID=1123272 RepID=A0A1N6D2J7_9SPHN|nr:DUF4231 domain-containing protein [Parasphingorhabdus marina]SIN64933.1 hypothetical protein SAMN02745824_1454 [Parasphingorhabdus marina DSM 22363]